MISPKSIASLGYIQKREKLASLKTPVNHNELILETIQPYPGYYSPQHVPSWSAGPKTKSLYLLIKAFDCCNEEQVTRIIQHVQNKLDYELKATPGRVSISTKDYSCIRLKLDSTFVIPELVDKFKEQGILFIKKRRIDEIECMINVQKFFKMHTVNNGLYQDMVNSNIYYLQLPHDLSWDKFEEITMRMKSSLQFPDFDAALANVYHEHGFLDFIRIYTPDLTSFDMEKLRDKYLKNL